MKTLSKYSLVFLIILTSTTAMAQEKILQLEHKERGIIKTIKENKRVRVKTIDGNKYKGRLSIIDENTIMLKGENIAIQDIEKIKRDPLLLSLLANGGFIYLGATVIGVGVIVAIFVDGTSAIPFFLAGGGVTALGILNPSFVPGKKMANGWSLSVLEVPLE